MSIDISQRIRNAGTPTGGRTDGRFPVYKVYCTVCGGEIQSDHTADVEYVETKRGTKMFFHRKRLERTSNG